MECLSRIGACILCISPAPYTSAMLKFKFSLATTLQNYLNNFPLVFVETRSESRCGILHCILLLAGLDAVRQQLCAFEPRCPLKCRSLLFVDFCSLAIFLAPPAGTCRYIIIIAIRHSRRSTSIITHYFSSSLRHPLIHLSSAPNSWAWSKD